MPPQPLEYRRPGPQPQRREPRAGDWRFAVLVGACYAVAIAAASAMPTGYHWSEAWEWSNFVLTVTACTGVVLFIIGLARATREGLWTCPRLNLITTGMAGALPIVQFFLGGRWLSSNFA